MIIRCWGRQKFLLVPCCNFYLIAWITAKKNKSKQISLTPTTPLFTPFYSCQFVSLHTHSVPIWVTIICLVHLLVCFAVSRIAKILLNVIIASACIVCHLFIKSILYFKELPSELLKNWLIEKWPWFSCLVSIQLEIIMQNFFLEHSCVKCIDCNISFTTNF